jgi:peptidoglycan/xylan/chitin deacetylase (PgdA/CDA1 family)
MLKLLKHSLVTILTSRPFSTLGDFVFGHGVPIFMLHRMQLGNEPYTGITPDHLRRCLKYLVDHNYHFISVEDIILSLANNKPLPENCIAFTMDDGFTDQADIAAPIFLEFACPVTFFVITGMLDRKVWPWDVKVTHLINSSKKESIEFYLPDKTYNFRISEHAGRHEARRIIRDAFKMMEPASIDSTIELLSQATGVAVPSNSPEYFEPTCWDRVRELERDGIKIAPHSISHRMLSKLDKSAAEDEIIGSWRRLKEELSSPSPVFCYPTGRLCDFGAREINILENAGLIGAVSTVPTYLEPTYSVNRHYLYNLPRFSLPTSFRDFQQYCSWVGYTKDKVRRSLSYKP